MSNVLGTTGGSIIYSLLVEDLSGSFRVIEVKFQDF
jgi:hypothetical protein